MKARLSDGSAVVVLIGDMNDPSKSSIRPRVVPFQTHSLWTVQMFSLSCC